MAVSPATVGDMDHAQGQMRRMRDSRGSDMHEVFQAPVLFGTPKVKLDWEPQPIIVYEWCIRQGPVTAAQHDRSPGLGAHGGLGEDDDRQWVRKRLVEQWHLGQADRAVPLHGRRFEVWRREGVVSPRVAILATGTAPSIGTRRREGQRRIVPELGHEVQAALARPRQGVGVATVPIQYQGGHREYGGGQWEQGGDPHQCRG